MYSGVSVLDILILLVVQVLSGRFYPVTADP